MTTKASGMLARRPYRTLRGNVAKFTYSEMLRHMRLKPRTKKAVASDIHMIFAAAIEKRQNASLRE